MARFLASEFVGVGLCGALALSLAACAGIPAIPAGCSASSSNGVVTTTHGCANATNISGMVADPKDLATGKTLGSANGARESKAVEDYKEGKVKELKKEQSTMSAVTGSSTNVGGDQ